MVSRCASLISTTQKEIIKENKFDIKEKTRIAKMILTKKINVKYYYVKKLANYNDINYA